MEDCLKIMKIHKNKNRIEYDYEINGRWKEFLKVEDKMFIEYDTNIESVPDEIAIIPLICDILPIAWVFNLKIKIDSIDKQFYDSIPEIKKGYSDMYPTIPMLGNIEIKEIKETNYIPNGAISLFSGGVDAFDTLFRHIEEKPTIVTIWGADIKLEDKKGWNIVKEYDIEIANKYNLQYSLIKTNFRTCIDEGALSLYVANLINKEWWHDFQHGIAILGITAPVAYSRRYGKIYIASSFTEKQKGKYTCASDPTIDNHFKFASCRAIHDGYECNRQDKIYNICRYLENNNDKINLRVCWKSTGGENCCNCEKCYRTILGIIAEKKDPNDFGFKFTKEIRNKMVKRLPKIIKNNPITRYECIQKRFKENYTFENVPSDLEWFLTIKIKNRKRIFSLIYNRIDIKIKVLKKHLKKIFKYLCKRG